MEVTVKWTPQAEKGLDKTILYLEKEWTTKEILQLEKDIDEFINRIIAHPQAYPKTSTYKNTYKGLVNKHSYIVYRIKPRKKQIQIINFRGTRQKPIN